MKSGLLRGQFISIFPNLVHMKSGLVRRELLYCVLLHNLIKIMYKICYTLYTSDTTGLKLCSGEFEINQ